MKRSLILKLIAFLVIIWAGFSAYRYFHFPYIRDWKSVRITLDRTGCFGACPSYRIEVRGDGTVTYTGRTFVAITGEHRGRISQDALHQLVDTFRLAHYFYLNNKYEAGITDSPTYSTSISFDSVHKSVIDYVGERALIPMPSSVSEVEKAIDRVAGSVKWLCGNAETVPSLVEEGWDFKSPNFAHASVLANVSACGEVQAVHDLVAAGAPVESHDAVGKTALIRAAHRGNIEMARILLDAGAGSNDRTERSKALGLAAETGNLDLVQLLLRSGGDPKYADEDGATVLMKAARSGVPTVVTEILKYHTDVGARDHDGKTVLMNLDKDKSFSDGPRPGEHREEVARILVHAGADVNARDNKGNTPLMEVPWNAAAARVLIENGAEVNSRNKEGWTPLTHASGLEVVRLLLESGADPFAHDEKGLSELENKKRYSQEDASLIEEAQAGKVSRIPFKQ